MVRNAVGIGCSPPSTAFCAVCLLRDGAGLVFLVHALLFCAPFGATGQALRVGGYVEHQLYPQSVRGKNIVMDYSKARMDLTGDVSSTISFSGNVVGQMEHGARRLNAFDFIPSSVVDAYAASRNESVASLRSDFEMEIKHVAYIDNAFVTLYTGGASLRVGRQQLPWGTGYAWNPSDIFLEKNYLDPTYEKRGVDAVRMVVPTSEMGSLTVVAAVDAPWRHARKAIRLSHHAGGYDFSVSLLETSPGMTDYVSFETSNVRRRILAADISGAVGDFGVWAEGIYSKPVAQSAYGRFLLGADHTTEAGLYLIAEYYHNGAGAVKQGDYPFSRWMDLFAGGSDPLARDYLFVGLSHPLSDLLVASGYWIANLSDASTVAYPYVEYSLSDNAVLTCIAYLTTGSENTEFGAFGWGGILRARLYF